MRFAVHLSTITYIALSAASGVRADGPRAHSGRLAAASPGKATGADAQQSDRPAEYDSDLTEIT